MSIISRFPNNAGNGSSGGGGSVESILDNFAYTGTMLYELKFMDGTLYHLLTFEASGELTVTGSWTGDIWMCGGGGCGSRSMYTDGSSGYVGGGGGYTANFFNQTIVGGSIVIGAGSTGSSNGGSTSYAGHTITGGFSGSIKTGGNGGCGGAGGARLNNGSSPDLGVGGIGQGSTTRPFTSQDMDPQCGGGGSPCFSSYINSTSYYYSASNGGTDGGNGTAKVYVGNSVPSVKIGIGGFRNGISSDTTRFNGYGGGGSYGYEDAISGNPGAVMIRIPV